MNELTNEELEIISGAGKIAEVFDDLEYVVERADRLYDKAIKTTTNMMCRFTGKC
ncbi:hypothetical protein [Massilia sp. X63]|uniref:hypothetical protein n=1 Tax=Massilia sp. X63 TaxID=3237285 RepID=UPI0034DD1AFC